MSGEIHAEGMLSTNFHLLFREHSIKAGRAVQGSQ